MDSELRACTYVRTRVYFILHLKADSWENKADLGAGSELRVHELSLLLLWSFARIKQTRNPVTCENESRLVFCTYVRTYSPKNQAFEMSRCKNNE